MSDRTPVFVHALDPLSEAGIAAQLRLRPDVLVVDRDQCDAASVAVVVVDEVDDEAARAIRAVRRRGCDRVVVVVTRLDDASLLAAVEAGASGLIRRTEATAHQLASAVKAAADGDGTLPPDLLGRLLEQVGRLQRHVLAPRGLTFSGVTDREITVLKLVADGLDTNEVASELCYSERTVKNVIHDVTTRLRLRNRTHAVAYALRQGLI